MNSTTLETINERLKDKPEIVLKQVLGYLDGIFENDEENWLEHNQNYQLSDQQKRELDEMKDLTNNDFMPAEEFHKRLKEKYGL